MDRRIFVATLAGSLLAVSPALEARPERAFRIGVLSPGYPGLATLVEAFREGLRDLGYVENQTVVIEYRSADGYLERLPGLAAELASLPVDVIVAPNTPAALAARRATNSLPIVFIAVGDPVTTRLVSSLARPGGNVTGVSALSAELVAKWLELLGQAVPGITRIAVLWQPGAMDERTDRDMQESAESAARALGVRLQFVAARGPSDLDEAFAKMVRSRVGAITVRPAPMFLIERGHLLALAAKHRLPAVYAWREFADAGGLMALGPNLADLYRNAATFVDKILRGAKPADLPVEQPTRFELVINLRTARALSLTIPPSLLAQADQVIE